MRTIVLTTAIALSIPALQAGAQPLVAVKDVAARDGYQYDWSPGAASAVLSRAGIVVVLRPGATVYQVNDGQEVANAAPRAQRGELYVTSDLAGRLDALSRQSAAAPSTVRTASTATTAQGSISLEARQLQGAEAIAVDGTAPPNTPVTITLWAIVSSDVPTIVVSRNDVVTDVSGHFEADIPIASAYERGTILKVVASSLPGVGTASAQLVTTAPNDGVDVPLEQY